MRLTCAREIRMRQPPENFLVARFCARESKPRPAIPILWQTADGGVVDAVNNVNAVNATSLSRQRTDENLSRASLCSLRPHGVEILIHGLKLRGETSNPPTKATTTR